MSSDSIFVMPGHGDRNDHSACHLVLSLKIFSSSIWGAPRIVRYVLNPGAEASFVNGASARAKRSA